MELLFAGATGLVGRQLLNLLEADEHIGRVDIVSRRRAETTSGKVHQHLGEPDHWPEIISNLKPDVAICAIGTTMRRAGSENAFAAVDHGAAVAFARSACAAGARQLMMVSSVGAHPAARNFYLSVKGRAEMDIQAIGFQRIDFFRPGLLRGTRDDDRRIGERLGIVISPIIDKLLPARFDRYRSIESGTVAGAIARFAGAEEQGVFVHHNRSILGARSA